MDAAGGQRPLAGVRLGVEDHEQPIRAQHQVAAAREGIHGMSETTAGPAMKASERWDYSFGVDTAPDADPAMIVLMGVLDWPDLTLTLSVAQFAAFKKGLSNHGVELTGVTRRRHPEATT
jgi:hypothetical protein